MKKLKKECLMMAKRSAHQKGKAIDFYVIEKEKISENKTIYNKLHDRWEQLGGKPMIERDMGHFEG
jgi:hypothetical protein